jgi:glycosyltransferase involved in cell wall biosynthesis
MPGEQPLRVLQGVSGQAGQPYALAAGLRRLGVEAAACTVNRHRFSYPTDIEVELSRPKSLERTLEELAPVIDRFDVFHFHARSFISRWPGQRYPSLLDLLILRMRGKKVFFHFRGQEVRLAGEFSELNPYNYVAEDPDRVFSKMPDDAKRRARDFICAVCNGVFAVDPELGSYVPAARIVPRVLAEEQWPFVGVSDRARPVVVHAPSRRGVKGTEAVLQAAESLKAKGVDFELRLVEGLDHKEAAAIYRDADIVVDQLRIGWYGVLAVETMALGKPTIAYIREDLVNAAGPDLPIVSATMHDIEAKLNGLIADRELRRKLAQRSRDYFLSVHASERVCRDLLRIYEAAFEQERPIDWEAVGRFLDWQSAEAEKHGARRAREGLSKKKKFFDPPYSKIPARLIRRMLRRPA